MIQMQTHSSHIETKTFRIFTIDLHIPLTFLLSVTSNFLIYFHREVHQDDRLQNIRRSRLVVFCYQTSLGFWCRIGPRDFAIVLLIGCLDYPKAAEAVGYFHFLFARFLFLRRLGLRH